MSAVSVEAPEYLNSTGCIIRNTPDKGRGAFYIEFTCDLVNIICDHQLGRGDSLA